MNRYESYKSSDIDWVGEIPSHWETVQPKYKLNRVTRPIDNEDEVITCFRDGVVTLRKNRREDGFTNSIKEHGYQQIHPGDLVVHEMDGFAGAIGISDSKGKSTPVYTVIEPDGRTDLKYIAYLLQEMSQSGKIESLARSIRERTTDFRWNMWSIIHFPFPPVEEQKLISSYLDKKINEIDSLIERIQKKIDLLKEQRTFLINHFVTKGLDPNVDMKDSGLEWIGEIPNSWELLRTGKFFIERSEKVNDLDYPPLSVTKNGILDQLSDVAKSDDNDNRKLVKKDDFVINSRSDRKGSSGIAPRDGSVSLINIVLAPKNIDIKYIEYLFKSYYFKEEYFRNGKGIHWDLWTTRWDQLKNIKIPVPPLEEQKLISLYLNEKTSQIASLVDKNQNKIELLKEYRKSLISSLVTGKVQVTEDMI